MASGRLTARASRAYCTHVSGKPTSCDRGAEEEVGGGWREAHAPRAQGERSEREAAHARSRAGA